MLRQGADCVKIAATGGVWSPTDQPDDEGFPEDEIRTITEIAAGHRGKKVAARAQGRGGILNAVRGGVAGVEHGYEIDDEAIGLMLERGTFLVPTLTTANTDPDPKKAAPWRTRRRSTGRTSHADTSRAPSSAGCGSRWEPTAASPSTAPTCAGSDTSWTAA